MPSKDTDDEECDATEADSSNIADNIKSIGEICIKNPLIRD
jgi:hypothetical protein